MKLTAEERARIRSGDHSELVRDQDPGDVRGLKLPIIRRKEHRTPIYSDAKFTGHARHVVGFNIQPEYWSLWIELHKPTRQTRHWTIPFTVCDYRPGDRTLAAGGPPGPPREIGLRTRELEKPREKGEGVGRYTDESARGYGGGGDQALDYGGVDDDELKRQRVKSRERWAEHLDDTAKDEQIRRQERSVREQLKDVIRSKTLSDDQKEAILASVQQGIAEAQRAA